MEKEQRSICIGKSRRYGSEVWMDEDDLRRHCYLLGKTGTGKTTCLLNMAHQWAEQGGGMLLLDPHGDLVVDLLCRLPKRLQSKVLLIESGEDSPAWNPFWNVAKKDRARVAQEMLGAIKGVFSESWGPRLEWILFCAIRLVLDAKTETFLGVQRLLTDEKYRAWLLDQCEDLMIERFWKQEFNRWDTRFQREAISSIQNKLGIFLADPVIRSILGQSRSSFSPRTLMDEEWIVLVSLSKGKMGEISSHLLGALLVAGFTVAALSRQEIPESERTTFMMMVDEFQNFTSEAFCSLLSEARKYGLGIIASHQHGSQLRESVRKAVIGNTGSHILFRLGGDDARVFHKEYGIRWEPSKFTDLPSFYAVTRLLDSGVQLSPSGMNTFPPPPIRRDHSEKIRRLSRERFTIPQKEALAKQDRWLRRKL